MAGLESEISNINLYKQVQDRLLKKYLEQYRHYWVSAA